MGSKFCREKAVSSHRGALTTRYKPPNLSERKITLAKVCRTINPDFSIAANLARLELPAEHAAMFAAEAIEMKQVALLTDEDLRGIGMVKLGHRKRMLETVEKGEWSTKEKVLNLGYGQITVHSMLAFCLKLPYECYPVVVVLSPVPEVLVDNGQKLLDFDEHTIVDFTHDGNYTVVDTRYTWKIQHEIR
uniref:SAM domain sterile alpha motif protein n=1 Tax=Marseillevirus LCMAC103 TaxID=2506604 RepID=A0A481YUP5_9VIRU|nr:MAG: SAM domain sterile alpha motif protein [Marseillevirus LCMAC103]